MTLSLGSATAGCVLAPAEPGGLAATGSFPLACYLAPTIRPAQAGFKSSSNFRHQIFTSTFPAYRRPGQGALQGGASRDAYSRPSA
jgi:hypothetical protein